MELFSQMYHKVFPSSINLPVPGIELQTSFMSLIFLVVINPSNKQISFLIYISFIYSNLLTHINLMFVSIHLKTDIIYMSFSSLQWNNRGNKLYTVKEFFCKAHGQRTGVCLGFCCTMSQYIIKPHLVACGCIWDQKQRGRGKLRLSEQPLSHKPVWNPMRTTFLQNAYVQWPKDLPLGPLKESTISPWRHPENTPLTSEPSGVP